MAKNFRNCLAFYAFICAYVTMLAFIENWEKVFSQLWKTKRSLMILVTALFLTWCFPQHPCRAAQYIKYQAIFFAQAFQKLPKKLYVVYIVILEWNTSAINTFFTKEVEHWQRVILIFWNSRSICWIIVLCIFILCLYGECLYFWNRRRRTTNTCPAKQPDDDALGEERIEKKESQCAMEVPGVSCGEAGMRDSGEQIPCGVLLLTSATTSSHNAVSQERKIRNLLTSQNIPFEIVAIDTKEGMHLKQVLWDEAAQRHLHTPRLMNWKRLLGTFEEMIEAVDCGELLWFLQLTEEEVCKHTALPRFLQSCERSAMIAQGLAPLLQDMKGPVRLATRSFVEFIEIMRTWHPDSDALVRSAEGILPPVKHHLNNMYFSMLKIRHSTQRYKNVIKTELGVSPNEDWPKDGMCQEEQSFDTSELERGDDGHPELIRLLQRLCDLDTLVEDVLNHLLRAFGKKPTMENTSPPAIALLVESFKGMLGYFLWPRGDIEAAFLSGTASGSVEKAGANLETLEAFIRGHLKLLHA